LTPSTQYNVDYSLLGTARVEPLLRRVRLEMTGAGMQVESAKGECNLGQFEIAFYYSGLLEKADEHVLYKLGAKEIAAQEGMSLSFMAKFDQREGNSCTSTYRCVTMTHAAVRGPRAQGYVRDFPALPGRPSRHHRDADLLLRSTVNSYKRFAPGTCPDGGGLGPRQPDVCVPRYRPWSGLRVECRIPGR